MTTAETSHTKQKQPGSRGNRMAETREKCLRKQKAANLAVEPSSLSSPSLLKTSSSKQITGKNTFFYSKAKNRKNERLVQLVHVPLPSCRKAGGSRRHCQLGGGGGTDPHKSWFEQSDKPEEEKDDGCRPSECYVWLSLPIRWQLNFNINMIILK